MTQMTVAEIVDETVAFYNKDVSRRSVDGSGICQYTDQGGRHCAIGRCLIDENFDYGGGVEAIWGGDLDSPSMEMDKELKEQYRGHTLGFWSDLQTLHDTSESWNEQGITEFGRRMANGIKRDHV